MMDEIHPMSDEEKAGLYSDIEYFPHKISDQDAAKRLLPNLYAKYITPDVDFGFTYRTDEDEAIVLLSEYPEGLRGIALRLLEKAKESIRCRSEYIDVTGQLRQDLTTLQHAVTGVLDDAMLQIREYAPTKQLMTADNLTVDDDLIINEDHVNAYLSAWFDVDKRFGTKTYGTDAYINLYADYYPGDNNLSVYYVLHEADGTESEPVPVTDLADTERETIMQFMRDAGLDDCVAEMQSDPGEGSELNFS